MNWTLITALFQSSNLATVADGHDNSRRRFLGEARAPVADAQTGPFAPTKALRTSGVRVKSRG
jgi:hypothetical protein